MVDCPDCGEEIPHFLLICFGFMLTGIFMMFIVAGIMLLIFTDMKCIW